jgi:hypothetical protein
MREGDKGTSDQEMSRCQNSTVSGVIAHWRERTRVEDGFNSAEKCRELLYCQVMGSNDSSEVVLHALDARFPQATMMRGCRRVKMEAGSLFGQELVDSVLIAGRLK